MNPEEHGGEINIRIGSAIDLQIAIQKLPRHSVLAKLPEIERMQIATIASELGANIIKYAGRGSLRICCAERMNALDVDIWAEDEGQGIGNIEKALTDRFSTGGTLGLGLPGVKRMSDEFWIKSEPGQGTLVFARKTLRSGPVSRFASTATPVQFRPSRLEEGQSNQYSYSIAWRPYPGNPFTGDAASVIELKSGCLMSVTDASGHGRVASHVAGTVTKVLNRSKEQSLDLIFKSVHEELHGTVGTALGLAYLDRAHDVLRYAATGNTRISKVSKGKGWTGLARDGVLGQRLPSVQLQEEKLASGDLIAMWTDGIEDYGGRKMIEQNAFRDTKEIASLLLKNFAKPYDDACCLVLRWK